MENLDLLLKDLTGKDEAKAQIVAKHLIDNADLELFQKLVDKTDFYLILLETMFVIVLKKL